MRIARPSSIFDGSPEGLKKHFVDTYGVSPTLLWENPAFNTMLWDMALETFIPGSVWQWGTNRLSPHRGTVDGIIAYRTNLSSSPVHMGIWMSEGYWVELWPTPIPNLQPNTQMFEEGYNWIDHQLAKRMR